MNLLARRPKRKPGPAPTELETLEAKAYPVIMAPWHGHLTPVQVRLLSDSVTLACGDFGLIKSFEATLTVEGIPTLEQMNAYAERHHEILKLTMVNPTYDEAMKAAGAHIDSKDIERQLAEIKNIWKDMPPGRDRAELEKEFNTIELTSKFILPADFTAFIVHYVLSVDKNDIDDMTEEMMLNCAILATRGGDNPSDHFPGRITPRVRKEFDNRAWILFDAEQKDKAPRKRR